MNRLFLLAFSLLMTVHFQPLAASGVQEPISQCLDSLNQKTAPSQHTLSPAANSRINTFFSRLNEQNIMIQPIEKVIAVSEQTNVPIVVVYTNFETPFFFTINGYSKPLPVTRLFNRYKYLSVGLFTGLEEYFQLENGERLEVYWHKDPMDEKYVWRFTPDNPQKFYSLENYEYIHDISKPFLYYGFRIQKAFYKALERWNF